VLITGGASGIGLETSLQMARRGFYVIIADRNVDGGKDAVARITHAGGRAEFRELNLARLSQIRHFAAEELALGLPLDVLINNAGILPPKERAITADGFELEFGIAHLGHFALTGLLLPAMLCSRQPRVVSVSSISHTSGKIDFDDLQFERQYTALHAYTCTKLACLMFALELNRRAKAVGSKLVSVAAHPGVSKTPIAAGWEQEDRRGIRDRLELISYRLCMRFLAQSAEQGAHSLVYAATEPGVVGGGYYGPTGFKQIGGSPGPVAPGQNALDVGVAARLWEVSARLTDVKYQQFAFEVPPVG